jgi:hypothetical protein
MERRHHHHHHHHIFRFLVVPPCKKKFLCVRTCAIAKNMDSKNVDCVTTAGDKHAGISTRIACLSSCPQMRGFHVYLTLLYYIKLQAIKKKIFFLLRSNRPKLIKFFSKTNAGGRKGVGRCEHSGHRWGPPHTPTTA